jgi:hypothetical protein
MGGNPSLSPIEARSPKYGLQFKKYGVKPIVTACVLQYGGETLITVYVTVRIKKQIRGRRHDDTSRSTQHVCMVYGIQFRVDDVVVFVFLSCPRLDVPDP